MFVFRRMGEHIYHRADFEFNRPEGAEYYLMLFLHTEAAFFYDGKWKTVPAGHAFVFSPGAPLHFRATMDGYTDSWILAELHPMLLQEDFPFNRPIPLHDLEQYDNILHLIGNEFYSSSPQREAIIHHMGQVLLHMLGRENVFHIKPPLYHTLVQIRREIYKHPEQEWSLAVIADRIMVSKGYLQRTYKQYFGVTCNQDVIQSRIDGACTLLRATVMPVESVAEACGYHNTEHFIRQFKKAMNKTPNQYRRLQTGHLMD